MAATTSTIRRATWALGTVAALGLLVQIGVVLIHYGYDQDYLDRAKTDQEVEAIAAAVSFASDGSATIDLPARIAHRYKRYPDSYAFIIADPAGNVLAERNRFLFPAGVVEHNRDADYSMTCIPDGRERLCVSSRRITVRKRPIIVSVAVSGDPANIVRSVFVQEIVEDVGVPIIPILLIMLIVNVIAVRRALRPLDRAATEARLLDPAVEGRRLSEDNLPSEVLALVRSINGLLSRAEQLLLAQREFTANAAHELRTPIAVLMLRLDELKGEVADRMRNDLKAMSRQVDQLLELAKVDAIVVGPNSRVDLAEAAHETVEALAILAVDRGCELAYENEGAETVRGSKDAIQLALRNLIDNAIRHSPAGGSVRVIAGPGARLQVLDQGAGIAPQHRERIFNRFWRGSQNEGAAGLGLAIVRHVAQAHGARIEIADAPGGGAHITIILDAAGPIVRSH